MTNQPSDQKNAGFASNTGNSANVGPKNEPKPESGLGETGSFDSPSTDADQLMDTRAAPADNSVAEPMNATQPATAATNDQPNGAGAASNQKEQSPKSNTLGDYRLLKKLGEGGMGTVYKAHQISLDRIVAVKIPFKHLIKDPSFLQRFLREARVMAQLDHPNILRCFGVGEEGGWHYLAMEFIDGASMESWLKRQGKLSVGDALHVVIMCAHALQHAHEQGLVHRDIKPDNILVTNKGVIKVADLGLAKALSDDLSLSRTGTGAGTPHYMAPEQARDAKHVDGRSDIYALGSMLYCFLAGQPPFQGETYIELLLAKEKGKHTPVRRFNDEIPERLDLIIDKTVAIKPEHRYQSCLELINDLSNLGLANDRLSFIGGDAPASSTGMKTITPPRMSTVVGKKPASTMVGDKTATNSTTQTAPPSADLWFISTKTAKGQTVKRKLTTAQVLEMIKDKNFDLSAQACRTLKGDFRDLSSFREFEPALRSRMMKAKADRKAAKFHNMYENILKEEKSYNRWRWFQRIYLNFTSWVTLVVWLVTLTVVGYVLYLAATILLHYLGNKVDSLTGTS